MIEQINLSWYADMWIAIMILATSMVLLIASGTGYVYLRLRNTRTDHKTAIGAGVKRRDRNQ